MKNDIQGGYYRYVYILLGNKPDKTEVRGSSPRWPTINLKCGIEKQS